ncbi:helix-turn-helix transcriptional regulator [Candidatus Methylobacter oryzae]|uniref:Helix-turn-helix transcriptional regulator n=1 Tax=Candidatus Methylobacter oryzae TaxID=2497749 RepID=A0ABY3C4V4_9GAMM|nr:helix-turn-helix transcriptional regulator [Candidatus Methylobacter oryzae]TRW89512.1 helix-turn-helix transcriptional regulator [Candidatus Methylobacter oryzae]
MNESQYDHLIGTIYDAAFMPELWPAFLEQLSDVLQSRGTALYLVDFVSRSSTCCSDEISFVQTVWIDPDAGASYDRYYSKTNVWFENSSDLPEGKLITTDRLFPARELIKTEWYNDWLKPQGYFHAMIGHLLKQDMLAVRLSIFRSKQQPFSAGETALFARLVPHLRRSCTIHKRFSEIKGALATNADILNRLPVGLILFDKGGQAVFINDIAETLSRCADGLSLNAAGRCLGANNHETRTLRQLIGDAADQGQSHALSLHRRRSNRPLSAIVVSLQKQSLFFAGSEPAVALFISDPDRPLEISDKLLMQCFDLSPAEAKLAAALLGGQTPSDYAKTRGISSNTVKTQLKQVLAKTGTHRQSELIQLLTTGFGMLAGSKATLTL